MAEQISFVIIDSSAAAISDIERILTGRDNDLKVAGTATNFQKGYELIFSERPTVVIMEVIDDDVEDSLGKIRTILSRFPRTFIFVTGGRASSETILTLLRAGATEYLPKPVAETDLVSAVRKLIRSGAAVSAEESRGTIYSVFSPKGGFGVTTVAINLAANIFQETGEPTIVVDLNHITADVSAFLNLRPVYTVQDALAEEKEPGKISLRNIVSRHSSGIHVLSQQQHIETAASPSREGVRRLLDSLRGMFRHIVLDTESHVSETTISVLQMSDAVIMIFVMSLPGIKNMQKYLNYLEKNEIRGEKIRVVANRFDKKGDIPLAEIESVLQRRIFSCIPNDYRTAIESLNKGMPVSSFAPESALNLALQDLAARMTGRKEDVETARDLVGVFNMGNFYRSLMRRFRET